MAEKEILELLLDKEKSIYEIWKGKKKKHPLSAYSPVLKMVEKLVKKGYIKKVELKKKNPRNAKWHRITINGLAKLYFLLKDEREKEKGKREDIKFHRSQEAKPVLDLILKRFYEFIPFDKKSKKLFSEVVYASPSIIEFFRTYPPYYTLPIKKTDYFEKMISQKDFLLEKDICMDIIKNDAVFNIKYYSEILPLYALANDVKTYKDNQHLFLLFKLLDSENTRIGQDINNTRRVTFENTLHLIRKGIIDLKNPSRKNFYQNYINYFTKEKRNCPEHWKLYIPPVGKPLLVCEGCNQVKKGEKIDSF